MLALRHLRKNRKPEAENTVKGGKPEVLGKGVISGVIMAQQENSPSLLNRALKIPDTAQSRSGTKFGADNGIRTRDPRLGKPMLYQLSYVRTFTLWFVL